MEKLDVDLMISFIVCSLGRNINCLLCTSVVMFILTVLVLLDVWYGG
jgi:hypothetical protein